MKVETFCVGPFQENTYLLIDDASRDAVLIDPGDGGTRLASEVGRAGATLRAIWITHAHIDHIGGIAAVRRTFDAPVFLHPLDQPLYASGTAQAAAFGLRFEAPPEADRALADGDVLALGATRFRVMHVPGHAPGHVAFITEGEAFVGDCLFAGSVGRTDLPYCSPGDLERSLTRLCSLPKETIVYPGHGPSTTIGAEMAGNPFLTGAVRIPRR